MKFFNRTNKVRADTGEVAENTDEVLLQALLGRTSIGKDEVKQIPEVNACIDLIAGTVSSMPIKLYKQNEDSVEEIKEDVRIDLLNKNTKDTLTSKQFWKAMIEDYYLAKGGYAYLNAPGAKVKSIHYVEAEKVQVIKNEHPIFKDYDIYVHDKKYMPFDFLKILRKTKDGSSSISIVEDNPLIFCVAYETLVFEQNLVKKGGNKRGFLKAPRKLAKEVMDALKEGFRKLYSNNSENVIVLNEGIDFKEASNTSVEMQLNENKESNGKSIAGMFQVPYSMISGKGTKEDKENFIQFCILPLLSDIECSLDRDLLKEKEKSNMYFAFDTKELTRGNIEERYKAYEIGLRNNFLQVDEVRDKEDMEPLGIEWIRLGLDSVLYDPKTKTVYTPNTNETKEMTGQLISKGGELENED